MTSDTLRVTLGTGLQRSADRRFSDYENEQSFRRKPCRFTSNQCFVGYCSAQPSIHGWLATDCTPRASLSHVLVAPSCARSLNVLFASSTKKSQLVHIESAARWTFKPFWTTTQSYRSGYHLPAEFGADNQSSRKTPSCSYRVHAARLAIPMSSA